MTTASNPALQAAVSRPRTKTTHLALNRITLDDRLQSRELKPGVVKEYAEALRRGEKFPPVRVVHDNADYYLVDGHHRLAANRELLGIENIAVEIVEGTFSDALWLSWGANRGHGLRRTQKDKRRAICAALMHPQWNKKSDREIARHIGCDHKTVAAMRRGGEFPTNRTTQDSSPESEPSKKAILQAARILAKVQPEQARSFSNFELAVVRASHEPLYRFLFGESTLKPRDLNQSEVGGRSGEGMNVERRAN